MAESKRGNTVLQVEMLRYSSLHKEIQQVRCNKDVAQLSMNKKHA